MPRYLLPILCLFPVFTWAQAISDIKADAVTYSQVRIQWKTDIQTLNNYVKYGKTGEALSFETPKKVVASTNHGETFTVPASTTFDYQVCSGGVCSATQVAGFTTLAAPAAIQEPEAWAAYAAPAMPGSFDLTYTVDPANDCNNDQTGANTGGLQWAIDQASTTQAVATSGHILIKIPSGTRCTSHHNVGEWKYYLKPRPGPNKPWIWIVASAWIDAPNTVPPPGVRLIDQWPESILVTITSDCCAGAREPPLNVQQNNVQKYSLVGIKFKHYPSSVTYKVVTAATNTTPVEYTIQGGHGVSTGEYAQAWDCVGNTGANVTTGAVTVIDANRLTVAGTAGNGALVGTCKIRLGPPYPLPSLVNISGNITGVSDIAFNQVKVIGAKGEGLAIAGAMGILANPVNGIAVVNSWFDGTYKWHHAGGTSTTDGVGEAFDMTCSSNVTFQNNYINWPGITIFGQTCSSTGSSNILVRRNKMEWDRAWMQDSEWSNGLRGFVRQQMEWKSADKVTVDANVIGDSWSCCNQTGNVGGSMIVFSARTSDGAQGSQPYDSASTIRDVRVTNNWIYRSPGCIYVHGSDNEDRASDIVGTIRVLVDNNVCAGDIDARKYGATDGSAVHGVSWYIGQAFSDVTIRNNTFHDVRGPYAYNMHWMETRGTRLVVKNNLFAGVNNNGLLWVPGSAGSIVPPITGTGTPAEKFLDFTKDVVNNAATSEWKNNVLVTGVINGTDYDVAGGITKATCDTWWPGTGTVCIDGSTPNNRLNAVKMRRRDSGVSPLDFDLRYDSPVIGAAVTTDGYPVGANVPVMLAAQGAVQNVRVLGISAGAATVAYMAPDSDACTVEYGTSATWGTGTRTGDGGGPRMRSVALSGLTPGATIHYRVLCAVEQPSGSFVAQ